MERNGSGRIIAVVALVVAAVGISLGFAAFSTSLQVQSVATVSANNNWEVGFSTDGTNIENVNTATALPGSPASTNGKVDVTKYSINQTSGFNAALSTTTGSEVTYTLSILNKGTLTAYPDSLTFSSPNALTCSNASSSTLNGLIEGTANAGTTSTGGNTTTISQEDCDAMFGVSLSIGGTAYTPANASTFSSSSSLAATTGSAATVLRIWYKDDDSARAAAAKLDGDIIVTVGTITVVYKSNNS